MKVGRGLKVPALFSSLFYLMIAWAFVFAIHQPALAFRTRLGDRHAGIIEEALGTRLSADALAVIIEASYHQDDEENAFNEFHFDNCALIGSLAFIADRYRELIYIAGAVVEHKSNALPVLELMGKILHAIHDFFAHSNWLELWAGVSFGKDRIESREQLIDRIPIPADFKNIAIERPPKDMIPSKGLISEIYENGGRTYGPYDYLIVTNCRELWTAWGIHDWDDYLRLVEEYWGKEARDNMARLCNDRKEYMAVHHGCCNCLEHTSPLGVATGWNEDNTLDKDDEGTRASDVFEQKYGISGYQAARALAVRATELFWIGFTQAIENMWGPRVAEKVISILFHWTR